MVACRIFFHSEKLQTIFFSTMRFHLFRAYFPFPSSLRTVPFSVQRYLRANFVSIWIVLHHEVLFSFFHSFAIFSPSLSLLLLEHFSIYLYFSSIQSIHMLLFLPHANVNVISNKQNWNSREIIRTCRWYKEKKIVRALIHVLSFKFRRQKI